jgi:hypothetical protein
MSEHNNEFGRRRPTTQPVRPAAKRAPSGGGGMSPLVKQIGGIALGVALVLALAGVSTYSKKQMGKELDRQWGERMTSRGPPPDIRIRDNEAMRSDIQTCDIGANGACK